MGLGSDVFVGGGVILGTKGVIVGKVETAGSTGRMKKNKAKIPANKNKKKTGITRT